MTKNSAEALKDLLVWARKNGCFVSPKVTFLDQGEDNGGVTLIAVEDIDERECIVSCVEKLIIGPKLAMDRFGRYMADVTYAYEVEQCWVKLALVHEKLEGGNSRWFSYINLLPTKSQLNDTIYYSDTDLKWLKGTNLYNEIKVKKSLWKDEFDRMFSRLSADYEFKDQLAFDLYVWSCIIFTSRSFPSRLLYEEAHAKSSILVPVIDLLNHKPQTPIYWDSTYKEEFKLSPGVPISKGKELFNNYGPKSNEELLFGYGFCIEDNAFDTVALKLSNIQQSILDSLRKDQGIDIPNDLVFYLAKSCPIPHNLIALFTNLIKQQNSQNNDLQARISGIRSLQSALEDKFNTLLQYSEPLKDLQPSNVRQKFSLIYRQSQEEIYKLSLAKCNELCEQDESKVNINTLEIISPQFLEKFGQCFGIDSNQDLVDAGLEDQAILVWLVHENLDYVEQFELSCLDVVDEYYVELSNQINSVGILNSLDPKKLAKAGRIMEEQGVAYEEDGIERFDLILR